MIIGVEARGNDLIVSYYDENGKIAYLKKRILDHEMFNWEEHDKPSINRNWDGKYLKKSKSDPKWITRTRLEELILEKFTPDELELVYNFDNLPKKSYLDIEIKLLSDDFPDPGKAEMPVGMISFCDESGTSYVLSMMDSDDHPNGLSQEEISKMELEIQEYFRNIVPHSEKDRKILNQPLKIKYKHFDNEKDLMEFYFHKIFPMQSFVTGWNVIDFDWRYLMNRSSRIGVDSLLNAGSRKTFSKIHKLPVHFGILDYMQIFQDPGFKPYKVIENYTLDHISKLVLNATKLKHEYNNMLEFQKDVYKFTMYNVIDNVLVKFIEDKLGLLEVAFSLANVAQIEVNKIFSPVHITEVLMCREFLNNNLRMMKKPWESNKESDDATYEGAFVMAPVPGYYEYISCYDFKSMYPNLQMQFNISPDSYLGKTGVVREKGGEIKTRNGTMFSSGQDSVAIAILNRLYGARIEAQDEIKKLKYTS